MKKKMMKLTTIVFVIVVLISAGGVEKAIKKILQSNSIDYGQVYSQVSKVESTEMRTQAQSETPAGFRTEEQTQMLTMVPTEAAIEVPTEAAIEVPTEVPIAVAQKQESAEKMAEVSVQNSGIILTDNEAKARAIEQNNLYRNMVSTILAETNVIRAGVGLSALSENATLTQIAMFRAAEMANSSVLTHTRPNGLSCFTVYDIYTYGYTSAGENLSWNSEYLRSPVKDWKTSEGHYKNMISTAYNQIGIGVAPGMCNGSQGFYYVQVFSN